MNRRITTLVLLLLLPLYMIYPAACAGESSAPLHVKKVENLPGDFIFGMDVSSVLAEERSGVKYFTFDGREADLFQILADSGINAIRVRIWVDPYDDQGHGFGGGNCDTAAAVEIGKRATAAGQKLIVDFHYSDFWADPSKQMVPRAWKGMRIKRKADAVHQHTKDCLTRLKEAGVEIGMVQIGNEINNGMCGEKNWDNVVRLLDAGASAVREVSPDALVVLHFTDPQDSGRFLEFAKKLADSEKRGRIQYDVFAASYYPFWHGTLENLSSILTEISETYGKKVMVMETSYPYTADDTDFSGNSVSGDSWEDRPYPFTVQGQADCIRDITDAVVNHVPDCIGVCWWEGAWITVGTGSWEENHEKWEKYGSGWASSYAAVYDPNDAGKYYGGSSWDNQAFFGPDGKPLESLKVFTMMRAGSGTEIPESPQATAGPEQSPVSDPAGNQPEHNYLTDYSFEDNSSAWVFRNLKRTQQLYVEDKPQDSLTGSKHAHFWSAEENSVEFTLEQDVKGLPEGKFRFSVSVMGGDCGATDIYAYVRINGKEVARSEQIPIAGWKNWNAGIVPEFDHPAGSSVTVGVYVKCQGEGNGAWGKIDDAMLNPLP